MIIVDSSVDLLIYLEWIGTLGIVDCLGEDRKGGNKMGAILKLTTVTYLLMGLGIYAPLGSYCTPSDRSKTSPAQNTLHGTYLVPLLLAEDPPLPPNPAPEGGGDAGGRYVKQSPDLPV